MEVLNKFVRFKCIDIRGNDGLPLNFHLQLIL